MTLEWVNIDTSYMEEEFDLMSGQISSYINELEEIYCGAYEYEPVTDYEIKKAKKLIRNVISKMNDIVNVINNTINEYYIILNAQIELMDIDEYHDLRTLINEAKNNTLEDMNRFNINKKIELLINLEKNINKNRNSIDICNKILNIGSIRIGDIYLIEPERFILPAEYIV